MSKYYFAYGSNMRSDQMADRCPGHRYIGVATLQDYKYLINSRGVATLIPCLGTEVHGLVYTITNDDEQALDRWEGVKSGHYYKKYLELDLKSGQALSCLLYLATIEEEGSPRPGYQEGIVAAAKHSHLPIEYIKELSTWLTKD